MEKTVGQSDGVSAKFTDLPHMNAAVRLTVDRKARLPETDLSEGRGADIGDVEYGLCHQRSPGAFSDIIFARRRASRPPDAVGGLGWGRAMAYSYEQ
jgi:hypothetical protein